MKCKCAQNHAVQTCRMSDKINFDYFFKTYIIWMQSSDILKK